MSETRRGIWRKDKEDRGLLKRGKIYYVRYADQHGKMRREHAVPFPVVRAHCS
jgi:hypothetical protein